jgi:hypothetical protein
VEIHLVFQHFLFVLGCSWVIFLRHFEGYFLEKHIGYDLSMQRANISEIIYLTSRAMEALDIPSNNGNG